MILVYAYRVKNTRHTVNTVHEDTIHIEPTEYAIEIEVVARNVNHS